MKKCLIIKMFAVCLLLNTSGIACSTSGVLVSKAKLYPSYIKTPQDIENWLIGEGFYYKSDVTKADEWKSPEQTVKDKAGDCEDYAVLTARILESLGYKNVMIIGMYGKNLTHGICGFQEMDGSWSFFSVGDDGDGKTKFYYESKVDNLFYILNKYFPKWTRMHLCTEKGYILKTVYRKDIEGSIK